MNKVKITLSLTKNTTLSEKDFDLHLLNQFQYCQVFVGASVMIQYFICNISVFGKNFNPETENILKNQPFSSSHPTRLRKMSLIVN